MDTGSKAMVLSEAKAFHKYENKCMASHRYFPSCALSVYIDIKTQKHSHDPRGK
jgi:hypothetical protein